MREAAYFGSRLVFWDAEQPDEPEPLPEGWHWRNFGKKPWWYVGWLYNLWHLGPLFGCTISRSFGWQPEWDKPIVLQPGESCEFVVAIKSDVQPL